MYALLLAFNAWPLALTKACMVAASTTFMLACPHTYDDMTQHRVSAYVKCIQFFSLPNFVTYAGHT